VFVEEVDGVLQGVVFRYTQGLEAGINRVVVGPDNGTYVGGIGSTGNWGQEGKERFGLQRLRYNGKPVFEPLAVRAFANGFEVEFTRPMAPLTANDPGDYRVSQWRYVPTGLYGGPKVDLEPLAVKSVTWSGDRTKAFLELDGLKEGNVVHIWVNRGVISAAGESLWTTEAWYTLNRVPARAHAVTTRPPINTLTAEERAAGFELLFDGSSLAEWRGYQRDTVPADWRAEDGLFACVPGGDGGDIVTREQFGDFELRLEWKISRAGNSGVMFRSTEKYDAPWKTGPEMQILDDDMAGGDLAAMYLSGSDYDMAARSRDMLRPTGAWNEFRIIAKGKHVQYWFNGAKVVEYTVDSPDWLRRLDASKFKPYPEHGRLKQGHIVLQNHGNMVWFRNIRIKRL
jgi:cytochrome c